MSYDPDEIVTLHGHAKMTLKTAVAKVMALPPPSGTCYRDDFSRGRASDP
jgi:hypothetical protein